MKLINKKMIFVLLIIVAAIILTIVGIIILPDTLVMQITSTGEAGTTMPKVLGLAVPLAMSTIFSLVYMKSNNTKHIIISIVGLLVFALIFIFN